jgi:nitrogen fixation NifU-like protein
MMKLDIRVEKEGSKTVIKEAKFKTFGCGSAIACSSLATEMIKEMTLDEASEVTNSHLAD